MRKSVVIGIITAVVVVAVVLTVTLVVTLAPDDAHDSTSVLPTTVSPTTESTLTPQLQGPHLNNIVAKTNEGNVLGLVSREAGMFIGVPFSEPPVGELRWRNPREPLPYPGLFHNATYEKDSCIQNCTLPAEEYSCPEEHQYSEDCLFLNIWVPRTIMKKIDGDEVINGEHYVIDPTYQEGDENSLAVMVFFYGGNFVVGSASVELYDSRFIADQGNVIGITVNYRLGPLGFLVQGSGDDAAIGNYGIRDQVRSLEWIQANIKKFGGNPNKVTVYGQSAGAESIGVMMTSPYIRDRGLFHQCIMESNPFGLPFRHRDNAVEYGARFAEYAGCVPGDMECLRNVGVDGILFAFEQSYLEVVGTEKLFLIFQPWAPVIEGDFLPEQPVDSFNKGEALQIPCIMGVTQHEAQGYIYSAFQNPVDNTQYRAIVYGVMKDDAPEIIDRYPPTCNPIVDLTCDNRDRLEVLTTWFLFMCATRYSLNSMTADSYYYLFNETWSFKELWGMEECYDKVCHAAELPYVFNMENLTSYRYDDQERVLANRMVFYWTNFAKYGNPNGDPTKMNMNRDFKATADDVQAVYWPKFKEGGTSDYYALQMSGELGDFVITNLDIDDCDFCDYLDAYGDR